MNTKIIYSTFLSTLMVIIAGYFIACGQTSEDARITLGQMNIPYTEEAFIEYAGKGDKVVVGLFLKAGMSPTPGVRAAVQNSQMEMVEFVIESGADPNLGLLTAAENIQIETVKLLIESGADVNYLVWNGHTKTVLDILLEPYIVNYYKDNIKEKDYIEITKILKDAGAKRGEEILSNYDKPPAPIGGQEAIQKTLKYPSIAKKHGIGGKVIVRVWISDTGKIHRTEIKQSLGHTGCDHAAVQAIKRVKWEPAKKENKPVAAFVDVQVIFELE